jgi:hypothetical protein
MSLVKFQKIMNNEIAKRVMISRPPEPPSEYLLNDPTNSIFIGITKIFNTPFSWTFDNLTNPHIAVVGITGAGKSFFVKTFLLRANLIWGTNAIIIDWAGEYRSWVNQSGGKIISLGKGDYINIMDLSGMKPLDRIKQIMTSFEILTDLTDFPEQKRLTEEAIEQSYVNFGFKLAEIPHEGKDAPTLKDAISLLEEKLQEGSYAYPAELENALYRLRQYAREGQDYFAKKSTLDLEKLASSGLVDMDLSGLPDENFRALAALFILQSLKEKMRAEGWSASKGLRAMVVLDEAWKVASDARSDAVMIVREGRKYQFGLIVASQNPTDINEAIFSNVGTNIMLRIKFEKFLNYLQGSLNFSGFIRSEMAKFGVGQAAIDMSFQTSVQFPEIFIIDRVVGEVPLNAYTITIGDVLSQNELDDETIQKEYYMERIELRSKLIESGVSSEIIDKVFAGLDEKNRFGDIRIIVNILFKNGVNNEVIVRFLRSLGIHEEIITKLFTSLKI